MKHIDLLTINEGDDVWIRTLTLCLALICTDSVVAAAKVHVVGLFPGAAVLLVNGKRHLVKTGQSAGGVLLVATGNNSATISIGGQLRTMPLGQQSTVDNKELSESVIQLAKSSDGHYWTSGKINGRSVRMVVDTNSYDIRISATQAQQLGLRYKNGKRQMYKTENGEGVGYRIFLKMVSVGSITAQNIVASVTPGTHPILLGMSFLRRTRLTNKNNVLFIEPKY